ncbi:hypothetical protein TBR22_A41980 [Luteitalea sp. TBR-22]|uniref:hypothetical protein n=1 Tax=Luteitalea sp. TBR-22 TaxID=2802971 RepID=UPI001AF6494B|nr:hypothetical protein [Luteitalea sp. TBR-22]BCS34972.1 hypothetical protein TBR22_A41980 [Luteitalea sp. TBR-22]
MSPSRPFRYVREPLFLAAVGSYVLIRAATRVVGHPVGWATGQQVDVLLLPVGLPPWLWLERRVGWRADDRPPTLAEVGLLLGAWSVAAEVLAPALVHGPVSDPLDVVAYVLGGIACLLVWGRG